VGDVAGREVSNAETPAVDNLTARELADALWLEYQWCVADEQIADSPDEPLPSGLPDDDTWPPPLPAEPTAPVQSPDQPRHGDTRPALPTRQSGPSADQAAVPLAPEVDRAIPRALRPLHQVVASHHDEVLDEEATAEQALVDPRWLPVFTPARERRWNIVLVIDSSPSMALWWSTARAVAAMLERQGAFRNVQIRLLGGDAEHGFTLRGNTVGAPRHGISDLLDPTGRRIVLVLTDGAAKQWQSGTALSVLRQWGRTLPVAMVHLLPWQTWHRTGLRIHRLRFRAPSPGAANARLFWRSQVTAADPFYEDLTDTTPIPVLGLGARWLGPWSGLVSGTTSRWVDLPAVLAGPTDFDEPVDVVTGSDEPARQVAEFRAVAAPLAFELATYLAAAPLDLDLMCTVQRTLLPASRRAHLTEVLASGLVESIEPLDAGSVRVNFDFRQGVREELLAASRRAATAHVMRVVEQSLADTVPEARGFGRILDDEPAESPELAVTALSESFLRVEMAALGAMSGNHLAASRRLQNRFQATSNERIRRATTTPRHSAPLDYGEQGTADPPFANNEVTVRSQYGSDPDTGGVEVPPIASVDQERRAAARPSSSPVVWGGVPPRNSNFTGREDLLDQLNERLEPGATTAVLPQALHGLGGVGKSQLAIEYAYRHRADFDVIWWIPAELPVQIQKSLVELGQRLNLVDSNEVNVVVDVVMDALKGNTRGGRQIPPNWLLVFDNAEDPEKVLEYLPTGGPGRILVTSRNSQWLNLARPLEVDVFQRQESIELLQRRDPRLNEDDGDRLASALGDLPLAIEQAAAWRAETGMPAEEYIQLLDEKQAEMLGLPGPLEYQRSVAAAWNVSLDKLRASNPTALRILQACAYFAPEPIPRSMFANARGVSVVPDLDRALHDRLRLNEAIRDINRYALARIDHRTNSIQMHRLVQAVLISQMTEDDQQEMRHAAHLLLAANAPDAPDDDAQWPKYGQLYPHVIASDAIECDDAGVRELVFNTTLYLYHWGEHDASRAMSQQVYDIWFAHLGAEHPDTLKVGRWLGFMLWIAGAYRQAAEFDAELLEIHRRVLGEDHEDTIDAINSVGGDRRAEGDFNGALELSRANHQRCIERFGDYDPLTLKAGHNLGVSLRLSGLFAEALTSDQRTWGRKVEIYGSDHLESLLTEVAISLDRRESGDYLEARTEHENIVARYRTLYGNLHHQTLRVIRVQSGMRRKAGDHEGAREAADEAYRGFSDRYGLDHPETIAAALNRSVNYRQAGELDQALQVGTDVLNRYQRTLGAGHPHTLSARTGLAVVSRLLGRAAEARTLNEEALQGLRARLGEDHPSTIVVAINLASDLFALGEVTAAHQLDVDTIERAALVLGEDHPTTLAGKANLAQDLRALGREQEGNNLRTGVVTKTAARLGATHPAVGEFANPDLRANCDIDPMPL
jgi:hypothetical protein